MVGFTIKKKETTAETKGFKSFSLKKQVNATKRPLLGVRREEDESVKKIAITSSEDLKPEVKPEIVIQMKPKKSLLDARLSQKEEVEDDKERDNIQYGLNIVRSESKSKLEPEITTSVLGNREANGRAKRKLEEMDQVSDDEPDYGKISVDDFGLLFLKGLGYDPSKDKKEEEKPTRRKYGDQMGLGSGSK